LGAYKYAELIDRLLNSCEYLDPRPMVQRKVIIPEANPNAFQWDKEVFTFRDEKILKVKDIGLFDSDGNMVERGFSYDFRQVSGIHPIFRICNHERIVPVSEPCHVHVGLKELPLFSDSTKATFDYAIHCIKNFYNQKPQDWEKGGE